MELQLDLFLSTTYNKGFDPKEMLASKPWHHEDCSLHKKRSFQDAFGKIKQDPPQTLPLLLWSGQPNDEDDDKSDKKRLNSCSKIYDEVVEEDDHVVGWPPIKSWRKKVLRLQQGCRIFKNRLAAAGSGKENNDGPNSKYVKVKMEGVAIASKIDIRRFHSYQTLTSFLITMFDKCLKLEKKDTTATYTLAYQDRDGDWLLAGDVPWQTLVKSVQRLKLMRSEG